MWTTPLGLPVVPEVKNIAATSAAFAFGDLGLEEAGMLLVPGAAGVDQRVERREAGLAVVTQAARVVVPDAREARA